MLDGLKVVDLTRLLPGPLCTMILGDYGAEVVKVEDPALGDPTRAVGRSADEEGLFFKILNRNKRSICLDLKKAAGIEIFRRLVNRGDVLVEGFRPGVMRRLGLDYEALKETNPGLVYVSISGYGQEGIYRQRAGHDLNYTALAGLLSLSSAPGEGPVMPAVQIADIAGGSLMALSGIMMALYRRSISGAGSYVDVSMTRALLPWLSYAAAYLSDPEMLPRRGQGHITGAFACYNLYETADGKFMSLGALEPVFWQNFCVAVGRPDWAPLQYEQEKRLDLIEAVRTMFKAEKREKWIALFAAVDACCEPVLDLKEAVEHPMSRELGFWLKSRREGGGAERQPGFPLLFSGSAGEVRFPAPAMGRHTAEILAELGYRESDIQNLKETGAINSDCSG
ncbi:MAG: CoA transferase [Dethiobacter sp.]|nr:CoA transferase [Dethiobacter sp.]